MVSRAAKMWMGGHEARSVRSRGAARARRGRERAVRAVVVRMLSVAGWDSVRCGGMCWCFGLER